MANLKALALGAIVCTVLALWLPSSRAENNRVHIAFLTDCTMYSDWQSVAAVFSYRRSRQPGLITRVMCCTDEEKTRYNQQLLSIVETHIAPSFAINKKTGDNYAAYNKPGAVLDWLAHVTPEEDWILVLDSDMYLRKPFYPQFFNASRGWAVSADYTYMIGVNNELADRHIPEIPKQENELAGPRGRRADQVGGFFFEHRDDLKRVAPLWLKYTEDVREDPESWRLTGDQYVEQGGKPWISEMYGYAFAAAKSNVWHKWDKRTMQYPTYRPTDCTMYSDWMAIGNRFSFKMSGQPGSAIRVMCCSEDKVKTYDPDLLKAMDTWVAPELTYNPKNKDHYAAYNKPEAVIDWLDHNVPKHDFVLVLDSDMTLRRPFFVEDMGPKKGLAVGARYTYMIGVANELAVRHIPHIAPRNDTLAGPFGRRGDQVGGFFFIHKDDLKAMSHDWLKYTEDVRFDDQAYRLSGDVYAVHPGDKPWISEMYGYAFGAANNNVWHKWDTYSMIYPGYEPRDGIPKLMHYGLLFEIGKSYSFDKHWHYDFDVTKCPPWDLKDPKRRQNGIFPEPPRPSDLKNQDNFIEWYRDLLAIETVTTLNAAFCDYHASHCPPSDQLVEVCRKAIKMYNEATEAIKEAESRYDCQDFHPKCSEWQKQGECLKNENYMAENCRRACDKCSKEEKFFPNTSLKELDDRLAKMGSELQPLSDDPDQKGDSTGTSPTADKNPDETKTVIIPKHVDSPKVASPPPPPPHSPPPSPPPHSPPPSPPPHSPPPLVVAAKPAMVTSTTTDKKKDQKQLLTRCSRMAMPLLEVKKCIEAAKNGEEYIPKPNVASATGASSPGDDLGAKGGVEKGAARILTHDAEDLTLSQGNKTNVSPPASDVTTDKVVTAKSWISKLGTWQVLVLWLLVVAAFLTVIPRILRMRRRQRSGMRTE